MGYTKDQFLTSAEHAISRARAQKASPLVVLTKDLPDHLPVSVQEEEISVVEDGSYTVVSDQVSKVTVRGQFDDGLQDWIWEIV